MRNESRYLPLVHDTPEGSGKLHNFIFLLAIPYFLGIHTAYKQQLTMRIFGAEGKRSI